ncbi:MAG TPA: hypothetical protein VGD48_00840 [Kutzneria sp.]
MAGPVLRASRIAAGHREPVVSRTISAGTSTKSGRTVVGGGPTTGDVGQARLAHAVGVAGPATDLGHPCH